MSGASGDGRPQLSGMKYLVESILSTDDSGTVMLIGDQGQLGRRYALKVIKREDDSSDVHLALAKASCEASAKLGHPVPLKYHDFQTRRKWFRVDRGELLMEYAQGKSLDSLGDLTLDQLIVVAQKLAAGLSHMHRRGVRHGDLAPRHVILTRSGEVKLLGYGLGLVPGPLREQYKGARLYQAPEQIRGKILGDRSDIYALGALLYHLMTGQPANVGGRAKGEASKISLPTRLNPAIPAPLNNLLVACLQSDPPRRPETMYEVVQRLDAIVKEKDLDDSILKGAAGASPG
jgi:serine/threonine protein kinase